MLVLNLLNNLGTDIFEMNVLDSLGIFLENCHVVLAAICKVTGIEKKVNGVGIAHIHHLVDFLSCLNNRTHVMMINKRNAVFLSNVAEL